MEVHQITKSGEPLAIPELSCVCMNEFCSLCPRYCAGHFSSVILLFMIGTIGLWAENPRLPIDDPNRLQSDKEILVSDKANWVVAELKLEMIWVKPGTFTMGSPPDEALRNKAEGPQTEVTLTRGYWLGKTEVTQFQYEAITKTNPSAYRVAGSNAPVDSVSWLDAMKYCEQLTDREKMAGRLPKGYVFTLPTEAQWEYACRAGTTTSYSGDPDAMGWFSENSSEATHTVGTKQANPWGFFDMSGNVLEWCRDWYGDYPGGSAKDPSGPGHGYYRIARGGSWRNEIQVGRSAARAGGSPGRIDYTLGFRLALCEER
ncbi:MAG: hypothetical protein JWM04_2568 [Verrucomicrobiales bacterium]|nr:hypothetical protein [Verrucomicrobiales bacterium]